MATTTPLAPNQASGFTVPQPTSTSGIQLTPQNMTIGQFAMPATAGTTTPSTSPTQGGLNPGAGVVNPTTTTSTGFTLGANGLPVATSAWSSPTVTQHPAAQGTNINPNTAMQNELNQAAAQVKQMQSTLTPTPPAASAPTNLNQGATTGGGQPFQGNYAFDSNGNITGTTPQTQPQINGATNPNQAAIDQEAQANNPAGNTAAQTNAIIQNLQTTAGQGSAGDPTEQALEAQIQGLQTNYGSQLGNITGSEMPEAFESGAANVLSSQYAPQLQALTQQLAALQANRAASIGAGESAAGASNTLQGLQQQNQAISPGQSLYNLYSGNNTASSALPLTAVSGGVGLFNPYTGQQQGGNATLSQLGGSGVMQSLAQQVLSGQLTEQQAESQLPSGVPAAALNQEEQTLQPGFNTNTATAQAQAQASNVGTAGTAQTTANQGVYNTALSNLANYQNMASNIQSFGNQAIQNISSLGLSPSQTINSAIQAGATQLNNPAYAQFNANIQGLQARVSALLGTGEIPSTASAGAQAIINGNLNLGSLQSTMNQINQEAGAIVQNQSQIASNAYSNIQGGTGAQSTSSGSNGTVTAGGYTFKQVNGQWVAQ